MASSNDIKNGTVLDIEGKLWTVIDFQHVKPGKGGAFVRTKMKSLTTGKVVDRTYNAGAKVDITTVDRNDMQYLYNDGQDYVFMDTQNFEQITVPADVVGDAKDYLLENSMAQIVTHEGVVLYIELPAIVEIMLTYTEPGLKGDRSSAGTKPGTLETGKEIQVPLFLDSDTLIKVDTRDGSYQSRVNK